MRPMPINLLDDNHKSPMHVVVYMQTLTDPCAIIMWLAYQNLYLVAIFIFLSFQAVGANNS